MPNKFVFGFGSNDIKGSHLTHKKHYEVWRDMLRRCFSASYKEKKPTYKDCSVCDDWLKFSSFKAWMDAQSWEGKQLDKDIINPGNKVYSPENCAFVDLKTNSFVSDKLCKSKLNKTGSHFNKRQGKFTSSCSNPFTNKKDYLGQFSTEQEAHEAWRIRKHELACELADLQTDKRVADALRKRYV